MQIQTVDLLPLQRANIVALPDDIATTDSHPPATSIAAPPTPRVLIITENASFRFGGEAVLPLHYFLCLRAQGIPVWMITNQRNRQELSYRLSPDEMVHLHFVPDGPLHRCAARVSGFLPPSLGSFVVGQFVSVVDQRRAVHLARQLIAQHNITVVHQPVPVSPKHVSALRNLGVPVVMGPMNGGINYPAGFRQREAWFDRAFVPFGRILAGLIHRLIPGKLHAEVLLVANRRTADALPRGVRGKVRELVENGVNLGIYQSRSRLRDPDPDHPHRPVRLAFAGRLVDWKAVDLLLNAFQVAARQCPLELEIMGDGPWRARLERLSAQLGLTKKVHFHGWMTHSSVAEVLATADIFVLPSLRECGGAAVLEAMAMGLPVIATNWGGPADYIDAACGILVNPCNAEQFTAELAAAMVRLAGDPAARRDMGEAGYQKVLREYDWQRKIERVIAIYREVQQPVPAR